MSSLQLDLSLPVVPPKGEGYAHILIGYGPEYKFALGVLAGRFRRVLDLRQYANSGAEKRNDGPNAYFPSSDDRPGNRSRLIE